jgi:hypothetical protein
MRLLPLLSEEAERKVQSGPFQGMRYVSEATGSALLPKLVGSYEDELHSLFENAILKTRYDVIVDVGCAEGYYAVGLALRLPAVPIYAYDIDGYARHLCRQMARRNRVEARIHLRGACSPQELNRVLHGRALIICDCEGYERSLLAPEQVAALRQADVLVELHDFMDSTITPTLLARFEPTHEITLLDTQHKDPDRYTLPESLSQEDRDFLVNEYRPAQMQWAWMTPRNAA